MTKSISQVVETYIFLCDPDSQYYPDTGGVIDNRRLPEIIKFKLSQGKYFFTDWKCANNKSIQVGDRAYLIKTNEEPRGFIASGRVVAAPDELQLRRSSDSSDLSAAYTSTDGRNYWVYLALDSVVDFDAPLEQKKLKLQPVFKDVNFYFAGGGKRFAPDNLDAVQALASKWEEHSLSLQRQGKGYRLHKRSETVSLQEDLKIIREELDHQDSPKTADASDNRKRILVEIARRQGQSKFRQILLDAYDYKCAVTGFDAGEALEAAHIIPYAETEDNDPSNGLLLRADIHTLFDINLLVIHPENLNIHLHPDLQTTEYRDLQGQKMRVPSTSSLRPNPKLLKKKLLQCTWLDVP